MNSGIPFPRISLSLFTDAAHSMPQADPCHSSPRGPGARRIEFGLFPLLLTQGRVEEHALSERLAAICPIKATLSSWGTVRTVGGGELSPVCPVGAISGKLAV